MISKFADKLAQGGGAEGRVPAGALAVESGQRGACQATSRWSVLDLRLVLSVHVRVCVCVTKNRMVFFKPGARLYSLVSCVQGVAGTAPARIRRYQQLRKYVWLSTKKQACARSHSNHASREDFKKVSVVHALPVPVARGYWLTESVRRTALDLVSSVCNDWSIYLF